MESSGYVVEPYWKYPDLLDILLNILKSENTPSIRKEAIRVLGLLGAVDPYKHKVILGVIDQSGVPLSTPEVSPDAGTIRFYELLICLN